VQTTLLWGAMKINHQLRKDKLWPKKQTMQINKIAQKLVQKLNNTKQCQPMSVNVAVNLGCDRVTETQHYTGMGCSHGHAQLRLFRRRMIE